jgi:hypothetical protein
MAHLAFAEIMDASLRLGLDGVFTVDPDAESAVPILGSNVGCGSAVGLAVGAAVGPPDVVVVGNAAMAGSSESEL